MDLNTPMPRHIDQLAKLGTSAFMCIALASIYPSLKKLESRELLSNTVALSILVISSVVSLCIQLRTGVIYTFKTSHVIMLTMVSLLLLHCIISAAYLSYFKCIYETNYQEEDRSARKEWIDVEDNQHLRTEKLKQYLKRFSMLAHSSCPHYLLGRTFQGTPPTVYGFVAAIAFFATQITSIIHRDKFLPSTSGSSISAYNWSVLWIFTTQAIALGVGTIVICIRGCYVAMVFLKGLGSPSWKVNAVGLEKFWMKIGKHAALIYFDVDFIKYSQHKSLVHKLISLYSIFHFSFVMFLVGISLMVSAIILIFWRSIMIVCFITTRRCITCELPHSPSPTTRSDDLALEEEELSGQYISPMPELEQQGSVKWIMKSILHFTQKYISAKERNTEHLEELLRQYLSADFRGVVSFDSAEVASLDSQGSPPNCWSLSVVTLTSIAIALPNVYRHSIVKLIKGVNEGLVLAKLIEDKFNNERNLTTIRGAAYDQWMKFGPWFMETVIPPSQNKSPIEILESIATSAENDFNKTPDKDPESKVVTHLKYRLCKTILMEHRNENGQTQDDSERIFKKLCATIADILGACLFNLKKYILMECSNNSSIEKRREAVSCILKFFGDTKKIMEIIETREIPNMSLEKMVFADNWHEFYQHQMQLP